jgi:hypothetical protein
LRLPATLLSIAIVAWAAPPAKEAPRPKLPPEVQVAVGLAYASPPEIAADAFLRLAASDHVAGREAKIQILEQAFTLAGEARNKIRERQIAGLPGDTRSGMTDRASRLFLDALSLRVRAVHQLLELDKAKAREMFSRLETPAPQARTCEDALVYDVSDFYLLLGEIADQTFTPGERRLEQHVAFLRDYVLSISSPVQVAPVARLLRTVSITPRQEELLVASLAAALPNVAEDNRSFLATSEAATQAVEQLTAAGAGGLKTAFDAYVKRQRAAAQCTFDGPVIDVGAALGLTPKQPAAAAMAKVYRYWTSGSSQAMLARGMKLRWGPSGVPSRVLTLDERRAQEWQELLTETLNEMPNWKPAPEESEADHFHQRCLFYETLVELTPPGERRGDVIAAFLSYLGGSSLLRDNPAEWLSHAVEILARLRQSGDPGADSLAEAYLRSDNPALALTARLEILVPRSPIQVPR